MDYEIIYYDMTSDIAYRSDGSEIANDNKPEFPYKSYRRIYLQLLNAYTGNKVFTDVYTKLAGVSVTASSAIDNDANHYYDANPNVAITAAAPIATIAIKNLSATPRANGRLRFTNAAGETEIVNYSDWSLAASVYTFTLADSSFAAASWTPTYSYLTTDQCRYIQIPIVKDDVVDCTDKDTGLFVMDMDSDKIIFQEMIEGEEEIDNTKLELKVIDASTNTLIAKKIPVKLTYLLDDDDAGAGGAALPGSPTWAEALAMFQFKGNFSITGKDMKTAAEHTIFTVPTGYTYRLKGLDSVCAAITGSGTNATIQLILYPAAGGSTIILEKTLTANVANNMDEDIIALNKRLVAGDVLKVKITVGSTYTTHTADFEIDGVLKGSGTVEDLLDIASANIYLTDSVTGITYQASMASGVIAWNPVP